jgi:hypothetical protein
MKTIETIRAMYQPYFALSINQRINERQHRNGLNINYLFSTVIRQCVYHEYSSGAPCFNTGIYHHIGRKHSAWHKLKVNSLKEVFATDFDGLLN